MKLYINGIDANITYGITLDPTGLSALMTPPGMKENVKNTSRLEHGTRVITAHPHMAARQLSLAINLVARDPQQFHTRYAAFCQVLAGGFLDIHTTAQPGIEYHLEYNSCSQFSQYHQGIAKFMLKLTENDPSDRTPRHRYT